MADVRLLADTGPLRVPGFRRLWAAGAVTALGGQLTAVTVPWQMYRLTGSSAYVGLAGLCGFLPMAAAALWGGALADRRDRRRLLLVTNGGIGVVSLLLWAQAAAGLRSVAALLALVAVQQAMFGANAAVGGAVVPRLVPAGSLAAANSLQAMASWTAGIAGPLLAGVLLPLVGARALYLADAVALCATLWAVWRLPPLPAPAAAGPAAGARRPRVTEGLRLLARRPVVLVAYVADLGALTLGLPTALFPQLAQGGSGADGLGPLYAALPVGGVLATVLSGGLTRVRRHGAGLGAAVCGWGLAVAGAGVTAGVVRLALLAAAGAALIGLSVYRKSLLQTAAEDGVRGRLQGADTVIAAGGPRLAVLAHGLAGAVFGAPLAITGGGLLTVALMLGLLAASPRFRRYEAPGPADGPDAPGVPGRTGAAVRR